MSSFCKITYSVTGLPDYSFIVNFYRGKEYQGDIDKDAQIPYLCESGRDTDKEYMKLFNKFKMKLIKHPSGAILDVCEICGGMWLDSDEVKLLHDYSTKKVKKWQKKQKE